MCFWVSRLWFCVIYSKLCANNNEIPFWLEMYCQNGIVLCVKMSYNDNVIWLSSAILRILRIA